MPISRTFYFSIWNLFYSFHHTTRHECVLFHEIITTEWLFSAHEELYYSMRKTQFYISTQFCIYILLCLWHSRRRRLSLHIRCLCCRSILTGNSTLNRFRIFTCARMPDKPCIEWHDSWHTVRWINYDQRELANRRDGIQFHSSRLHVHRHIRAAWQLTIQTRHTTNT